MPAVMPRQAFIIQPARTRARKQMRLKFQADAEMLLHSTANPLSRNDFSVRSRVYPVILTLGGE